MSTKVQDITYYENFGEVVAVLNGPNLPRSAVIWPPRGGPIPCGIPHPPIPNSFRISLMFPDGEKGVMEELLAEALPNSGLLLQKGIQVSFVRF
jgi:hypothetical protein